MNSSRLRATQTFRWVILFMGLAASLFVFPAVSLADHGSWTHHDLHFFEQGTSQYAGYADVDASDQYDYAFVLFERYNTTFTTLLHAESVVCGAINEGCGYRKTTTYYWPQTASGIAGAMCAYDGSHKLSGVGTLLDECTLHDLPLHRHTATLY